MASNVSQKPHECQVCLSLYDEEKRPRSTKCGHTFCSECIRDSLKAGLLSCPRCRKEHYVDSVESFPINYDMEALIAYMTSTSTLPAKSQIKAPRHTPVRGIDKKLDLLKEEQKHEAEQLVSDAESIENDMLTYMDMLIKSINSQKILHTKVDHLLSLLDGSIGDVEKELKRVSEIYEMVIQRRTNLEDQLEISIYLESVDDTVNFIDGTDHCISELETIVSSSIETVPNATVLYRALKEQTNLEEVSDEVEIYTKQFKLVPHPTLMACVTGSIMDKVHRLSGTMLTASSITSMSQDVLDLVEAEKLFTVHVDNGIVRSSKIGLLGNKLVLHSFRNKEPPAGSYIVEYNDVKKQLDPNCTRVFLVVTVDSKVGMPMIIQLCQDTPYGQQFAMLCSGERGPSYRNTKSYRIHNLGSGESLYCGKFANDEEQNAATLVTGLKGGEEYFWPYAEGSIAGTESGSAEFIIVRRGWTNLPYWHRTGFGKIEEGLDIIASAIDDSKFNLENIKVVECGLVLINEVQDEEDEETESEEDVAVDGRISD